MATAQPSGSRFSLVVGFYRDNGLIYAARVRAGLATVPAIRREGLRTAQTLKTPKSPFRQSFPNRSPAGGSGPHYREDGDLCLGATRGCRRDSVSGMDWSRPSLRHTKFVGLKDDKDPAQIVKET